MARRAEEVVAIGFDYRDHLVTIACPACAARHEVRVPAVMMVVDSACPRCGRADRLEPAELAAACARLLPVLDPPAIDAADAAVAALVRGWATLPEVAPLLDHAGVDLGAGAALKLVPLVLRGLLPSGSSGS
jgi:hypothetical protein